MAPSEHPRVAIVAANPLRRDMANGIFMRSFFSGWPRDRLAQVYFPVAATYLPEFDVCHTYRMIRTSGLVRRFDGAHGDASLDQLETTDRANTGNAAQNRGPCGTQEIGVAREKPRLLKSLRKHLQSIVDQRSSRRGPYRWLKFAQELWYANSWIGSVLEEQLRELKPDVVYAVLGAYSLTRITCRACERLKIPLYIHVVDDFVSSLYQGFPFAARLQAASEQTFREAVSYAAGLAAISPSMAEEYRRRYGGEWDWFTTLVAAEDYDPAPRPDRGELRFVYAGNLSVGRWRPLREIALALQKIRGERGIDVRLTIYSAPDQTEAHRDRLDFPPITELRGWARPDQLPNIFHQADVLVHVESFDSQLADLTRLSLSTKLGQYAMAGRCILAVGPDDLASVRMVKAAKSGVTVSEMNWNAIAAALEDVVRDEAKRAEYGRRGRQWATQWVDQRSGQERFRCQLAQAASQRGGCSSEEPDATG